MPSKRVKVKASKIKGKSKEYKRALQRASNAGVEDRRNDLLKKYRGIRSRDVQQINKNALPGGVTKIKKSDAQLEDEVQVQSKENKDWFVVDALSDSYSVVQTSDNTVQLIKDDPNIKDKEEFITKYASLLTQVDNPPEEKTYSEQEMKQIFESKGIPVSDDFASLYDENTLWRFHDGMRVDGATVNAFMRNAMFVVGTEYPKILFDVNRSYPSKDMEKLEIQRMNNNFVYWSIQNEIERYDRTCNTWAHMFGSFLQLRQYGRFCLQIQWDPETDMPVAIKPLNAMRLGRPFVDIRYWNVVGVEYFDFKKPSNILFAEDIVYGVNRDYHQSPGSYRTGYSDMEPIMHLVELNVIINTMDLKEINKRFWIPYILVKVNSENRAAVSALKLAFKTGTGVFSTIDYTATQMKIEHNGDFILAEREKNDEKIIIDSGLPGELAGQGKSIAQAQTSQTLQGYNQTTVSYYQLIIRNIWEYQWYGPLLMKIIKRRLEMLENDEKDPIIEEERVIWKEYMKMKQDERRQMVESMIDKVNKRSTFTGEPTPGQVTQATPDIQDRETLIQKILDETEDPAMKVPSEKQTLLKLSEYAKFEELPCKIKLSLPKKSFDTDLEKGAFYSGLLKDQVITKEYEMEKLGFDDLLQQAKAQQQIDLTMAKIMQEVIDQVNPPQLPQDNQPPPGAPNANTNQDQNQNNPQANAMNNAFNRKVNPTQPNPNVPTTGVKG